MSGGGSGGGGGATQSTVTNTNIPEYARPYVETMLGATQQQLFNTKQGNIQTGTDAGGNPIYNTEITGIKPYQPYSTNMNDYMAGFSPMQQQAQQGIANMQVPGEYGAASGITGLAAQEAMNLGYQGERFGNQFQAPQQYMPGRFRADRVGTQSFTQPGTAEDYMNPYAMNALQPQLQEQARQAAMQGQALNAQAVGQGAFGGSRQALQQSENQRNLGMLQNKTISEGMNTAYNNAQQQFNADQARQLQAQQANQSARMQAQQLGEQSRQFGAGQGMTAAQQAAQYGLGANQLNAQQQQFGANYGLQALNAQLAAANQLASIGGQGLQAQQGIYGLQQQTGAQQQALEQSKINQAIQNYATAQQYPQQQLAFMNSMLRGLPLQTQTVQGYQAAPSFASQAAGLGTAGIAGLGLYNTMNRTQ